MMNINEISNKLKSEGVNYLIVEMDENGNGWVKPEGTKFSSRIYGITEGRASYDIANEYLDLQNVMNMVHKNNSRKMIVVLTEVGRSIHGEIYKAVKVIN